MIAVTLVVLSCVGILLSLWIFGRFRTLVAIALLCMAAFPRVLIGALPEDAYRSSISGEGVRVFTYTVAILLIVVAAVLAPRRQLRVWPVMPFLVLAGLWALTAWDGADSTWAGLVHLATGALAWVAGGYASVSLGGLASVNARFLSWAVLIFVALQAVVCFLQWSGVPIFPGTSAANVEDLGLVGRANGTFSHPAMVGKVMLLLLVPLLPLTTSTVPSVRRVAWAAVITMAAPLTFSSGRANFVGYLGGLLIWALLAPSARAFGWKLVTPLFAGLTVILTWGVWSERIASGEDGTMRDHFADVAIREFLARPWWLGVGPGNYVEALGSTDPWIAAGWPVHNTFLLAAVELGAIVAGALFLPLLVTFAGSVRRWRLDDAGGAAARAFIATLPGVLLIAFTGWGFLAEGFPLWMFVTGWVTGQFWRDAEHSDADLTVVAVPTSDLRAT